MGEKWAGGRGTGAGIERALDNARNLDGTPYVAAHSGIASAVQQELAPSRTPSQRAQDIRANDSTIDFDTQCALDALEDMIAEQGVRIDGLHDLIEQQQQGARHLARRIDNLDMAVARIIGMLPSAGEEDNGG